MDYESDHSPEQQVVTKIESSIFDDNYNWEYFTELLDSAKEQLLETEFTGLFEKCDVVALMKFIEDPSSFNILYETNNLPRHYPLKKDVPRMPHPMPHLNQMVGELLKKH